MEIPGQVLNVISAYKYAGLYALFVIDTLGVFMPSKTILTLCGILVQSGSLSFAPLFVSALAGSLTGFCISYTIGLKIGRPFLSRYGKFLKITGRRIEAGQRWFSRFGPAFIILAYFTPGLRHVTPYLSGISGMSFPKTLACAAAGAALWITTFVSLGRFFGQNIDLITALAGRYQWAAILLAAAALSLLYIFKKRGGGNKE